MLSSNGARVPRSVGTCDSNDASADVGFHQVSARRKLKYATSLSSTSFSCLVMVSCDGDWICVVLTLAVACVGRHSPPVLSLFAINDQLYIDVFPAS